jgi:hypothetical protein
LIVGDQLVERRWGDAQQQPVLELLHAKPTGLKRRSAFGAFSQRVASISSFSILLAAGDTSERCPERHGSSLLN